MQQGHADGLKIGRRRRMRLLLGILFAFLLWAGYTFYQQGKAITQAEKRLAEYQQQIKQMNQEKSDLEKKVKQLQDKNYVAELARKTLLLTKKGEVLFVTPEQPQVKK